MQNLILILQAIFSLIFTVLILIQPKSAGLGRAFGGGSASFTRRGFDKAIFRFTFIVAGLFVATSIVGLLI